jgi:hypothetical protein
VKIAHSWEIVSSALHQFRWAKAIKGPTTTNCKIVKVVSRNT